MRETSVSLVSSALVLNTSPRYGWSQRTSFPLSCCPDSSSQILRGAAQVLVFADSATFFIGRWSDSRRSAEMRGCYMYVRSAPLQANHSVFAAWLRWQQEYVSWCISGSTHKNQTGLHVLIFVCIHFTCCQQEVWIMSFYSCSAGCSSAAFSLGSHSHIQC